jgi:hypothetical protein
MLLMPGNQIFRTAIAGAGVAFLGVLPAAAASRSISPQQYILQQSHTQRRTLLGAATSYIPSNRIQTQHDTSAAPAADGWHVCRTFYIDNKKMESQPIPVHFPDGVGCSGRKLIYR